MFQLFGKRYLQKNRRGILYASIFLLLFLQIAEAAHQHPLDSDLGASHCLACHQLHSADQLIHGTSASFDLLAFTDERIVNLSVYAYSHDNLTPCSRSPPIALQ